LYYMLIYISNPVCILTTLECDNWMKYYLDIGHDV
jgi:hypothetical protein